MRTIVIGDLHGCYEEALDLLGACAVTSTDRVIFVGDLIDRGPSPAECVELAVEHESVLGNHEEKHLHQRRSADEKLSPDHLRTRKLLTSAHYDYFAKLPKLIELPEHGAAVVHAGALAGVALHAQDPYHLLHAQCVRPPEKKSYWPSKAPPTHTFWTQHWKGPERIIFGHTVVDRPHKTEFAVGIDTGCVYGGPLTAVILPDWKLVSVPSRQPKRRATGIGVYDLHEGVRAYS